MKELMDSKELADILVRNINEKVNGLVDKLNVDISGYGVQVNSIDALFGSEWIDLIANAVDTVVKNNSNEFRSVSDETPPSDVEILAKSPNGTIHLTHWRPAYDIFTCQEKREDTSGWVWKNV